MKRLKGAIDRQIAEEQSKQKASAPSPSSAAPGSAARRSRSSSGTKTQSPARRPRKKPVEDTKDTNGDGLVNPDPAVFEAAFVIDDEDAPSRVATPAANEKETQPKSSGKTSSSPPPAGEMAASQSNGVERAEATKEPAGTSSATPATELSPEVQTRLRKLEKMERAYPGLYTAVIVPRLLSLTRW
jgi:hypothetical protein